VTLREPLADVEAEPGAGRLAGPRRPEERREEQGNLICRNADTVIGDANLRLIPLDRSETSIGAIGALYLRALFNTLSRI